MAATVLQKLKEEGWFISDEGLKKLCENGSACDVKELTKRAIDYDLRELVTNGGLPNEISKSSKVDLPASGVVVQIINIKNVSAPKANQESKTSPRLLQIDMTDGQTVCSGLDLEHLSSFNINIAPGTKVLLKNTIKIIQGFLALTPQNICIFGGHVQALFEKWETVRALSKYGILGIGSKKGAGESLRGTPPPWIPFGTKTKSTDEATFKSLDAPAKAKEVSKEENEFLTSRNNAIAEASAKGELRKSFGGNNRQLVDHNLKKILDKGYTEEQAKLALKIARNNLERAMNHLKKRNTDTDKKPRQSNDLLSTNSRRGNKMEDHQPTKPSGKVSLFDFLSDKIPDVEPEPTKQFNARKATSNNNPPNISAKAQTSNHRDSTPYSQDNQRTSKFENNISSSFANRQKKHETYPVRNKWNEHDGSSNEKAPNHSTYQQPQRTGHHQQQLKSKMNQSKPIQSKNQYSNNINQQGEKGARYSAPATDPPFPQKHQVRQNTKQSNTLGNMDQSRDLKNIIESTANMQINPESKQHSQKSNAVPMRTQASHFEEVFPEAKRFPYNPYKIMGFQNRETNEFAMNVLKTQMNDQKSNSNVNGNKGCQMKMNHNPNIPVIPVQQNVQGSKSNQFINTSIPTLYNLPPTLQPAYIQPWNFKVGDRCLAKYWEDEKYYNAEIQAVTDKTCVVHFFEYGNFEEILHGDCLPITDANHQPINQFASIPAVQMHPAAYAHIPPSNKAGPTNSYSHPTPQQQRFGNRQLYVPPTQRK